MRRGKRDGSGPRGDCQYKDGRGSINRNPSPKRDGSGQGMRKNRKR